MVAKARSRGRARPATSRQAPPGRRLEWPLIALLTWLLLVPATAWAGGYFWVQSSVGQARIWTDLLGDLPEGAITARRMAWGPDPRELAVLDLLVRGRDQKIVIAAGYASARLDVAGLLDTGPTLNGIRARDFEILLSWDASGVFNLGDAFRVEKEPEDPDKPKKPPPYVRLDDIVLERGRLTLDWPAWGLRFEALDARGEVHLGGPDPLVIHADLTGGEAEAHVGVEPRHARFDSVTIDAFRWEGQSFHTDRLHLGARDGAASVDLAGGMGFGAEVTVAVEGSVRVGASEVGELATPWLPEGVVIEGLRATSTAGAWTAKAARLSAAEVGAGPVRLSEVSLPFELELQPGALMPKGRVAIKGARAASLEGPENIRATGIVLTTVDATLNTMADVRLAGAAAESVSLLEGPLGAVTARGAVKVGLAGGELEAAVGTAVGSVTATGRIDVSMLRRKGEFTLDARFEGVAAALARALGAALPEAAAAALGEPVTGVASFAGEATPGRGPEGWEIGFELTAASLRGASGARAFVDGRWGEATLEPAADTESPR